MTDKYQELAVLCEAASGPDRELDRLIHVAVNNLDDDWPASTGCCVWLGGRYTASIDAALTLAENDEAAFSALADAMTNLGARGWHLGQWTRHLPRFIVAAALRAKGQTDAE